jgi:magnesium transporter
MALSSTPLDIVSSRITTKFLSVQQKETVGDVKRILAYRSKEFETIDYVYVLDHNNDLKGVVSLKEIFGASEETRVETIMKRHVVSIDHRADQERIINLVLKNNLKAIPVVEDSRLIGVVPYNAILDIFHQEFREDILKAAGIHHDIKGIEDLATPFSKLVRARLPSLLIGLAGGLIAAYIVNGFEEVLSSYLILAAFMPVMIYLSDAVGTQSQTLIVRMIAMDPYFSPRKYLTRELKVGATLGIIFAVLLFVTAIVGWGPLYFGAVIGASIFASILFQAFIATYLSIALTKFRVDLAVASGPITTIISDVTTLIMYFSIASSLLRIV